MLSSAENNFQEAEMPSNSVKGFLVSRDFDRLPYFDHIKDNPTTREDALQFETTRSELGAMAEVISNAFTTSPEETERMRTVVEAVLSSDATYNYFTALRQLERHQARELSTEERGWAEEQGSLE